MKNRILNAVLTPKVASTATGMARETLKSTGAKPADKLKALNTQASGR